MSWLHCITYPEKLQENNAKKSISHRFWQYATSGCAKALQIWLKMPHHRCIIKSQNQRSEQMSFSENLQFLRKRDKITQEELADKLQVSRQSVSKWETGEAYPETEKIIALCDIFNVTMDVLMRGNAAQYNVSSADRREAEDCYGRTEGEGEENCDPPAAKKNSSRIIGEAISGAIMVCAVVAYLCMGIFSRLWHPGWLVFLLAVSLCAFVDKVFKNNSDNPSKKYRPLGARILKGLADMTLFLSITVYLFIGLVYGIWHPSWVIFIIAPVLIGMFDSIAKAVAAKDRRGD